jgi:hypothetical protein
MKPVILALAIVFTVSGVSTAADSQGPEKDWCLLGIADTCSGIATLTYA